MCYYYDVWNKIFQTVFYGILHPKGINKNPLPHPVPWSNNTEEVV